MTNATTMTATAPADYETSFDPSGAGEIFAIARRLYVFQCNRCQRYSAPVAGTSTEVAEAQDLHWLSCGR